MAEIGLLSFARVALQVARSVLPAYRSRFSKHQFNQPPLLAVLCLMRYEDWTFRLPAVGRRSRGAAQRAPGVAACAGTHQRSGLHDAVSVSEATG